jgi:hypothetical protein
MGDWYVRAAWRQTYAIIRDDADVLMAVPS